MAPMTDAATLFHLLMEKNPDGSVINQRLRRTAMILPSASNMGSVSRWGIP